MKKILLLVALICGFSFGIRAWRVTEAPPSVNWDEAALGYNAFSLLETGRDEFGKALPVSLRSFDDYKPAMYAYLAVPWVKLFGLGEFSTRLPSIISGTILVFLVGYISAKLSGKMNVGIAASIILAISPGALHFSRIAFEANVATMWYFLGIALFVLALKEKKYLIWSLVVLVMSMYTYHAQRAIAVPTFILLILLFKIKLTRKGIGYLIMTFGLLMLPLLISFATEPAGSRLSSTIVFKLWPFVPKEFNLLLFNPVYTWIWQEIGQFLAYFSPINIFVRGSLEPILGIPSLGLLPMETLPLWLMGWVVVLKEKKLGKVLGVIMLLAPLPGVITWNWFSVVRTLAIYPTFAILIALGWNKLGKWLKIPMAGILLISAWFTILTIGIYAPWKMFGEFQPGFEKMVPEVMEKSKKYESVVVDTGQATPYIFFLFYGKYPPKLYQAEANRDLKHTENYGYQFGKFIFRKIEDYELYKKNILLVGQTNKLPEYEIKNAARDREINYTDYYDLAGYTSIRVVEL